MLVIENIKRLKKKVVRKILGIKVEYERKQVCKRLGVPYAPLKTVDLIATLPNLTTPDFEQEI